MATRSLPIGRSILASLFAGALLVACGGGSGGDSGSSGDDCKKVAPSDDGRTEIEVVAKDMDYVDTCYEVEPGTLVVNFTSDDGDIAHNFHITGNEVNEATNTLVGDSEVLEVNLEALGDYDFKCDPHPEMTGVVKVAESSSLPG